MAPEGGGVSLWRGDEEQGGFVNRARSGGQGAATRQFAQGSTFHPFVIVTEP